MFFRVFAPLFLGFFEDVAWYSFVFVLLSNFNVIVDAVGVYIVLNYLCPHIFLCRKTEAIVFSAIVIGNVHIIEIVCYFKPHGDCLAFRKHEM